MHLIYWIHCWFARRLGSEVLAIMTGLSLKLGGADRFWDLYLGNLNRLTRVEECWRALKSRLRMQPVNHWCPHRVCATCRCACWCARTGGSEIRAGDTWRNLRVQPQTIKIVEYRWGSASSRLPTCGPR